MGAKGITMGSYDRVEGTPGTWSGPYIPATSDKRNDFFFEVDKDKDALKNRAIFLGCWDDNGGFYSMSFVFKKQGNKVESTISVGGRTITVISANKEPLITKVSDPSLMKVVEPKTSSWWGDFGYQVKVIFGAKKSTILTFKFESASDYNGYISGNLLLNDAEDESLKLPTNTLLASSEACPQLRVFSSSEVMYGNNLTRSVFRVMNSSGTRSYIRRPSLASVMRGEGCTFSGKVYYWNMENGGTEDLTNGILTWGMLRYFLWYLTSGKWCVKVIESSYNKIFERTVSKSEYACWLPYLNQFSGYAKYYN